MSFQITEIHFNLIFHLYLYPFKLVDQLSYHFPISGSFSLSVRCSVLRNCVLIRIARHRSYAVAILIGVSFDSLHSLIRFSLCLLLNFSRSILHSSFRIQFYLISHRFLDSFYWSLWLFVLHSTIYVILFSLDVGCCHSFWLAVVFFDFLIQAMDISKQIVMFHGIKLKQIFNNNSMQLKCITLHMNCLLSSAFFFCIHIGHLAQSDSDKISCTFFSISITFILLRNLNFLFFIFHLRERWKR